MSQLTHPQPNELLGYRLGEATPAERRRVEAHLGACEECGRYLELLADTLSSLDEWPEEAPPADGLARLLTAIAAARPARPRREEWLRPVLLSLAGVLLGVLLIYATGARLGPALAAHPAPGGPLGPLAGFALAALAFFAAGSLLTLALAPALILELQSRRRRATAR